MIKIVCKPVDSNVVSVYDDYELHIICPSCGEDTFAFLNNPFWCNKCKCMFPNTRALLRDHDRRYNSVKLYMVSYHLNGDI